MTSRYSVEGLVHPVFYQMERARVEGVSLRLSEDEPRPKVNAYMEQVLQGLGPKGGPGWKRGGLNVAVEGGWRRFWCRPRISIESFDVIDFTLIAKIQVPVVAPDGKTHWLALVNGQFPGVPNRHGQKSTSVFTSGLPELAPYLERQSAWLRDGISHWAALAAREEVLHEEAFEPFYTDNTSFVFPVPQRRLLDAWQAIAETGWEEYNKVAWDVYVTVTPSMW
jgi:hypothetical protein